MEKKTNTKEDESERKRDSAHPTHANFPSRYDMRVFRCWKVAALEHRRESMMIREGRAH